MKKTKTGIELFAGAGGLCLGLSELGVHHELIVELNKAACDTINSNRVSGDRIARHWPEPLSCDVRDIDFRRFASKVDLLSGGPPCQPFSMGGKHRAHLDVRDMFPEAIRAVRQIQPRAFIFENVRGLMRESFASYFKYIIRQLEFPNEAAGADEEWHSHFQRLERRKAKGFSPDYQVTPMLVDAADYGVPQRRHRVFIVGIHRSLGFTFVCPSTTHSPSRLLFDQYISGEYWDRHKIAKRDRPGPLSESAKRRIERAIEVDGSLAKRPWETVRDAICDLPDPERRSAKSIAAHEYQPGARAYPGHSGSNLDAPAKAIKAGGHGVPGGENMLRKPDGSVRYFTIRESARLQTFPDGYMINGSWGVAMRQLGNAVPKRLAVAMGSELIRRI